MNKTQIEWVKNPDGTQGYTCNSKTGCRNHVDGMCKGGGFPCYAYRLARGRLRRLMMENLLHHDYVLNMREAMRDPFYPRFWPERLEQIRKRQKPTGIFLNDMSDWMGDYWPEEWTEMELQVMRGCPQHRFYLLTKQPQNLVKFSPFPDNCWVGVTACNDDMFCDALFWLRKIEARVKYISIEPYLERIEVRATWGDIYLKDAGINWVIIGAQTKPTVSPKIEWVEEIVRACDKAGVAVFLKDNLLSLLPISIKCKPLLHGAYKLRQELPE